MEAIIVALISGFFSLGAIWVQNYLQKKNIIKNQESPRDTATKKIANISPKINIWRITFTLILVLLPLLFLLIIGKDKIGGDKYLMEYYFIWVIITSLALGINWKSKTLFEKIILTLSLLFLVYMTFFVMYETKRNAQHYGIHPSEEIKNSSQNSISS